MSELNLWPDLDADESTQCVFDFINVLREELKTKYDGKISCVIEEIIYKDLGIDGVHSAFRELKKIMGPSENLSLAEKNKDAVRIRPPKEYKFIISNDKCYFRLFDIKLGEYFPIMIRPAEGILTNNNYEYYDIKTESDFKQNVVSFLHSKYVKDVIRYLTE